MLCIPAQVYAMPLIEAAPVVVSERERSQLEALARQHRCPQQVALRARVVLAAAAGEGVLRERSSAGRSALDGAALAATLVAEQRAVAERLADAPRPGTPATFSAEQICAIVAMACEAPARARPITHWTHQELADEALKRGIVASISPDSVGRFLKKRPTSSRTARAPG